MSPLDAISIAPGIEEPGLTDKPLTPEAPRAPLSDPTCTPSPVSSVFSFGIARREAAGSFEWTTSAPPRSLLVVPRTNSAASPIHARKSFWTSMPSCDFNPDNNTSGLIPPSAPDDPRFFSIELNVPPTSPNPTLSHDPAGTAAAAPGPSPAPVLP